MGEGLQRIAETYGGMRVSARGETVDYITNENALAKIKLRKADGWEYIGLTPDGKFLRFQIATSKNRGRGLTTMAVTDEVAQIAQAVLTALNVGDIQSGSSLHLKLRATMIAHRMRHREITPERWEELQVAMDRDGGPTEAEAEEVLRHFGTSGKEVANQFIERLMRGNLEARAQSAAVDALEKAARTAFATLSIDQRLRSADEERDAATALYAALKAVEELRGVQQ